MSLLNKKNNGQTLIEAMVAVAVIAIALIGFLSRSTFTFLASRETIHRGQALNLARDGIEAAKHIRDSNWLQGCPDPSDSECRYWDSGLFDGKEYRALPVYNFDYHIWKMWFISSNFDACVDSDECRLYQNKQGFLTAEDSVNKPSDFFRQVELNPICAEDSDCQNGICQSGNKCSSQKIGIRVISRVRWKEGSDWRNVELEEYLYNWR